MAKYYPVMLDLEYRPCLVVGGGRVAQRKVEGLIECEADVTVVSPQCTPHLIAMADKGVIRWIQRGYQAGMAKGFAFVCAASDDAKVNEQVAAECRHEGILVNVVDNAELSCAIIPAVLRRGNVIISVSTSGHSPALAARIRDKIADIIGPEYGLYNDWLGYARKIIMEKIKDSETRRDIFKKLIDEKYIAMIKDGDSITLEAVLNKILGE